MRIRDVHGKFAWMVLIAPCVCTTTGGYVFTGVCPWGGGGGVLPSPVTGPVPSPVWGSMGVGYPLTGQRVPCLLPQTG